MTEHSGDGDVQAALALLSADERARYGRFVFPDDRRDFAEAHALLRRVLSLYAAVAPPAWIFDAPPGEKPALVPWLGAPPLSFNLSHTRGLVACAVALDADVGVDAERIDRVADGEDIAARYFTAGETAALMACDSPGRATRFIELWTLKEAYLKAIGRGLARPLNEVAFAFAADGTIAWDVPGAARDEWRFALFPLPNARIAAAVTSPRRTDWNFVCRPL